jgi:diguanylate cyclase (GGDEF)-like protein
MGFDLWMVTRTEGDDWIVLQSEDHGYGVPPRTVFRWADSFCSRMISGNGPRIAPRSAEIPAYSSAPIARQVQIGAYVGVPLTYSDGSLFGTLCAIHPTERDDVGATELPLVELLAAMLSSLLNAEIKGAEVARLAELHREAAELDELTGLFNRRGWNRFLTAEEERCCRYAHPASVLAVDLDGLKLVNDRDGHAAGDELIVRAAKVLAGAVRKTDVVARTGGDEFLVLAIECDQLRAASLARSVEAQLSAAGVSASVGHATRIPSFGLLHAAGIADQAMYERKAQRKTRAFAAAR